MPVRAFIGWLLLLGCTVSLSAQTITPVEVTDTLQRELPLLITSPEESTLDTTERLLPDPVNVVWWAAAIPGYGQIRNRKYWKLPIVYAGFYACYYAINWNSNRYTDYKNGYLDITDSDPSTISYLDLLPEGRTMDSYGGRSAFTGLLKTGMEKSRYNRDLSVIVSIAYYGLTIIDAFVDAHLADFDISTDLSLQFRPVIMREQNSTYNISPAYSYGLMGRVKF